MHFYVTSSRHIHKLSNLLSEQFPLVWMLWEDQRGTAYLAHCVWRLHYHGVCQHFLVVEIIPRNSHFLFHKGDSSLSGVCLFTHRYWRCTSLLQRPPQPPQYILIGRLLCC